MISRRTVLAGTGGLTLAPRLGRAQGKSAIKITRQPSIIYMPTYIMEAGKLFEEHAARLGVPGLSVEWITFNGGGGATDALLAESVDMVNTGVGNMLLLWDRTRGRVKGIVATCAEPLVLVSREPRIRSLADFRSGDKIAVPTIKVSTQSILLSIAAEKMFGKADAGHFDPLTVQLGHPDAVAAMLNQNGEISSHFSAPPFFAEELKRVPGCHVVTTSSDLLGHPMSQALLFTSTKFGDANPLLLRAARAAVAEAVGLIQSDPSKAVGIYRQASGDKLSTDELLDILKQPGMADFSERPQGTMAFAQHLYGTGLLKKQPESWKDYFFSVAHDLDGS